MTHRVLLGLVLALVPLSQATWAADSVMSRDDHGRLRYIADSQGNTLPDFSRAGYGGGGVAIPDVKVIAELQPQPTGDDTERIQDAINAAAKLPSDQRGIRGAILLRKGEYRVAGSLQLNVSGVVLRGEGQYEDGTVILATGDEKRTLIHVGGHAKLIEDEDSRRKVADDYVPWGATQLTLESTQGLSVGDAIIVHRPSTAKWISAIAMDRIVPSNDTVQWAPGTYDFKPERTITAIAGNTITIDAPIMTALDTQYGGGYVARTKRQGQREQIGVEHLRLVSEYDRDNPKDEKHAWTGIALQDVDNAWVRNITTVHFSHAVSCNRGARFITVQDSACLDPVSLIKGGRRYAFDMQRCQYTLVQRCYTRHSRHSQATGARTYGPNVFLDCLNEQTYSDAGPHHRWAAGTLWDNLEGGPMNVQDRGNSGTGHGWAGAVQVFWNCRANTMAIQQPPTSQNYAIGCTGQLVSGRFKDRPQGHIESHGTPVKPRSLYLQQLHDRLGPQAVENVTIAPQRDGTIHDWLKQTLAK